MSGGNYPRRLLEHVPETVRARDERPDWGARKRRLRPEEYKQRSNYVRFRWNWVIDHPKVAELSDAQLRAWFVLVGACVGRDARDGRIELAELPAFLSPRGRRKVTEADLEAFETVGLVKQVDDEPGAFAVRDWGHWNPIDSTAVYRQRAWRERQS